MARTIRERMNVRDNEVFNPLYFINARQPSFFLQLFFLCWFGFLGLCKIESDLIVYLC